MPYSLKDAAEATGKSKPTILRAIQKGKISAAKDQNGEWRIEPAELHRVYETVPVRNDTEAVLCSDAQHKNSPFEMGVLAGEVEQLRLQIEEVKQERERERREAAENISDLRRRLDEAEIERRTIAKQLTALLTDQREPNSTPVAAIQQPKGIRSALRRFIGS